jgi:hypothetical protein
MAEGVKLPLEFVAGRIRLCLEAATQTVCTFCDGRVKIIAPCGPVVVTLPALFSEIDDDNFSGCHQPNPPQTPPFEPGFACEHFDLSYELDRIDDCRWKNDPAYFIGPCYGPFHVEDPITNWQCFDIAFDLTIDQTTDGDGVCHVDACLKVWLEDRTAANTSTLAADCAVAPTANPAINLDEPVIVFTKRIASKAPADTECEAHELLPLELKATDTGVGFPGPSCDPTTPPPASVADHGTLDWSCYVIYEAIATVEEP